LQADAGETVIARYEYDGRNRRTKVFANADTDDDFDRWQHFYYNSSWQILETRLSESENTAPDTLDVEMQYVWSTRYIDAPVLRDRDADEDSETGDLGQTDSGLEERVYYLTDANPGAPGNVTCLVDTGGDVAERYVYDPYGNATVYSDDWSTPVAWAASKKNPILYCGYYFDNETGIYSVRRRYYHTQLGRWISRDPIGYVDGMGLYEYTTSAPVSTTDALGTSEHGLKYDCKDSYAISRSYNLYALNAGSFDVTWTVDLDDAYCHWEDHGEVISDTNRLSSIVASVVQGPPTFSGPSQEGDCSHVAVDVTVFITHDPYKAVTLAASIAGLWNWAASLVWEAAEPSGGLEPDTIVYFEAELRACCGSQSSECQIEVLKNDVSYAYRRDTNKYSDPRRLVLNPRTGSRHDYWSQVTCDCEEF
jgi:RHS repeat-associated protein